MTTKTTKLIGLGRTTAAITFTRNSNRRSRHVMAGKQEREGNHLALLRSLIPACLVFLVILGITATSASAETQAPVWKIIAAATPTNFVPGTEPGVDTITVMAINVGGASTDGSPVTISDSLPAGITATEARSHGNTSGLGLQGLDTYRKPFSEFPPNVGGSNMQCSSTSAPVLSCTEPNRVDPGDTLIFTIPVSVETAPSLPNVATVSGGGAASASVSTPVTVSSALPAHGVSAGGSLAASSTSQAGAHPNVTTAFFLNTVNVDAGQPGTEVAGSTEPVGEPKDVGFDLPPGLVGTTVGMPRCTMADVENRGDCPRDTMVGTATIVFYQISYGRVETTVPVFNIAPAPGEPAAFGFFSLLFPVRLDTSVLSDGDYGVRVTAPDITAGASVIANAVTIWGVPAEHSGPGPDRTLVSGAQEHENELGPGETLGWRSFGGAGVEEIPANGPYIEVQTQTRVPLLTNPSQCSTPLEAALSTDSWQAPGVLAEQSTSIGTATGCNLLSFKPGVSMLPDTLAAGAPAGYSFDLNVPQNTEAESFATPDVKRTSVTLPEGTVISPSAADGLGVCSNVQFFGSGPPEAKPATPGECPRDSQVGTVSIETPALEKPLTGAVYLAEPVCTGVDGTCTPQDAQDGNMIRLFVQVVGEGESGIVVKLEGKGSINQQTGQITTTFENTPQLPFSNFELTLQGGERATLANPRTCGEVHTTADLTAWSTPFTPDASPESNFDIDQNCFGAQFNPSFTAGTTSNQAGGFSPFTVSFGRADADQFLNGVQIQMPPGLLGLISKVKLCEEPQAAAGTCSPESQVGETSVETGPGADPFLVTGGKIYITGPYKGAPYGLSIVVPAKAGPYTLSGTTGQGTVVVRAAIGVNPETAALTVTVDPLPTELDGIPLQLRLVNATVGTNNDFTFNPTNCNKLAVGGALTSTEAAKASASPSFQVTNCGALKFKPSFAATSNAHTSKKDGASLLFKISYPQGSMGTESWLKAMKFDIPKQLPARLTTLQKSCLAATFEANPAACPSAAVIGKAIVHTPVLAAPLEGPVYFVSHGGAKFPEVVVVLQADNVTLELHGETFISKTGVTSATFRTVPDAPFESAEVFVPTGPNSEFAAIGNICTEKLTMPNEFTPQSGTEIKQNTKIGVTGCPKAKKAVKKKTKKKGKKASNARKSSTKRGAQS
jgi:hypothetical protein